MWCVSKLGGVFMMFSAGVQLSRLGGGVGGSGEMFLPALLFLNKSPKDSYLSSTCSAIVNKSLSYVPRHFAASMLCLSRIVCYGVP